jgi:uncharacterized protein
MVNPTDRQMKTRARIEENNSNTCPYLQIADTDEYAAPRLNSSKWSVSERGKRYLLAAIGIGFVGLGAIGAILPGIPTVGPLLVASFCFSKSCPWLEKRLIRNRFFARFIGYLDGNEVISLRMRFGTIATMWASIGFSFLALYAIGQYNIVLVVSLVVAGLIGTVVIARFRRVSRNRIETVA